MSREITEKQRAWAVAYYTAGSDTFGNGCASYRQAYPKCKSDNAARVQAGKLLMNANVIALKKQIQAKITKEYKHNEAIAIDLLRSDYKHLETAAKLGSVQAIQARTAIIRELNSACGVNRTNISTTDDTAPRPADEEQAIEASDTMRASIKLTGS